MRPLVTFLRRLATVRINGLSRPISAKLALHIEIIEGKFSEDVMVKRVAVFVDGENISCEHAEAIYQIAIRNGPVHVQRVYGNATILPGWQETPGYKLVHSGTGKNATDLLLSIEAVELCITEPFSTVVIVSSDGDFTHLATRLRERGMNVVGIGREQAPDKFRAACSEFEQVEKHNRNDTPCARDAKTPQPSDLDLKILKLISEGSTQGQGVLITDLSQKMRAEHGTLISTYPEKKWRPYFLARKALFDLDPRGPEAKVRFRRDGFEMGCLKTAGS